MEQHSDNLEQDSDIENQITINNQNLNDDQSEHSSADLDNLENLENLDNPNTQQSNSMSGEESPQSGVDSDDEIEEDDGQPPKKKQKSGKKRSITTQKADKLDQRRDDPFDS